MPQSDRWPFRPTKLSSLIEPATLAVLLSGCSARLERPITVLDYDYGKDEFTRIDMHIPGQNYSDFCWQFRNGELIEGGNKACEACDIQLAQTAFHRWHTGKHDASPHECHMKLIDYSHVITVLGEPVGVLLAGQFGNPAGPEPTNAEIDEVVQGKRHALTMVKPDASQLLKAAAANLNVPPPGFVEKVTREVHLIEKLAEEHHLQNKIRAEQDFLDQLRTMRQFSASATWPNIRQKTQRLLKQLQNFCRCQYIIFYINFRADDTILTPLAEVGLNSIPELPHFNWRKAGLHQGDESDRRLLSTAEELANGLRGDNAKQVRNASCAVASMLGEAYRAVMVFGPFEALKEPKQQQQFLFQINRIVGWFVFAQLQTLRLREEVERREAMSTLLQHRIRTALTPISTHIGSAKHDLDTSPPTGQTWRAVADAVRAAHVLALRLGKSARETLRSADIMVERDDLHCDIYPLSVLIANCAEGFIEQAAENNRRLVIEDSIENLPSAEVDIARLTIAISNLLENAVKYSYSGTSIYVRALPFSLQVRNLRHVDIQVEDLGNPIPRNKMDEIFKRGERALVDAKMGKIPGTGYGLWETKAVVEAHGGTIDATSENMGYTHKSGPPHKVVFTVRIPLSQSSKDS